MNMQAQQGPVRTAIEIAISLLLIFIVLSWCLKILMPFVSLIVWGAVIAIAVYNPFLKLRSALGGNQKLAVLLFAVLGLAVVLVPATMFVGSIAESAKELTTALEAGQVTVSPPNDSVKDWPVVGKRLHASWSAAATNLEGWLTDNSETIKSVSSSLLSKVIGIGLGVLQFVLSTLIAAVLLANAEATAAAMRRFCARLVGWGKADEMLNLTTSTVRSVAVGVMGIAFIQAFLGGLGLVVAGVPAAGLWALFILILGIAQLPPLLILAPAIVYVFSVESTTVSVVFMVWSIAVSFSDMVLKPLLLGRGVEAPMLVILLGAIGGMVMSGIIGLFVGAVVLALGYKLLQAWLDSGEPETPEASDAT